MWFGWGRLGFRIGTSSLSWWMAIGPWSPKNSYDFRGPSDAPGAGGYYTNVSIHSGLVCLNADDMNREMQIALFGVVLDAIQEDGDLVNSGLEATLLPSGEIVIERYALPDVPQS